ncbi:MAG TPA: efflux RND transporter permease subunit, partial [Nitrosomonas sp.]|nr:efflux RND transporter permease subunit [Nitrosomonas sp.]
LGDNAIIVIENVTRLREKGAGIIEAAISGAKDINLAVTASTLTNVAIFLPIMFVEGVGQQLFVDMAITMTVSLMVSLLVAVTLVPMLVSRNTYFSFSKFSLRKYFEDTLHRKRGSIEKMVFYVMFPIQIIYVITRYVLSYLARLVTILFNKVTPGFYNTVDRVNAISYQKLGEYLEWGLKKRFIVVGGTFLLFIGSILIAYFISSEPAPDIDNSRFIVQVKMPKGASLEGTTAFVRMIEKGLLKNNAIEGIYSSIGITADMNFWSITNTSMEDARLEMKVKNEKQTNEVIAYVREQLHHYQTMVNGVEFALKNRGTTFEQILRPEENDIKLLVHGRDQGNATLISNQFSQHLRQIVGLTDLRTNLQTGNPENKIVINREQASMYGLSVQQVAQFLADNVKGKEATTFNDFIRKITIRVRPTKEQRKSIEDVLALSIATPRGTIPLRELVHWEQARGHSEIWRENQQPFVVMTANVNGRSLGDVVEDIQHEIDKFPLPDGYSITIGGENEDIHQSFRSLFIIIALSLFLVYMILAAEYESVLYPFVIIITSPLAYIGAIAAMMITGQHYNIMSLIGLVIMIGAVDNDAVIAVDIITAMRREGKNLHDSIKEGMQQRLRPILITTGTTILGIIPLVFEFGTGSELVRALTIPLVGGMISSTFFTIATIPIVYTYIDRWAMRKIIRIS